MTVMNSGAGGKERNRLEGQFVEMSPVSWAQTTKEFSIFMKEHE